MYTVYSKISVNTENGTVSISENELLYIMQCVYCLIKIHYRSFVACNTCKNHLICNPNDMVV